MEQLPLWTKETSVGLRVRPEGRADRGMRGTGCLVLLQWLLSRLL